MLKSLSTVYGRNLLVVVLTGMVQDGLEGGKVVVSGGGSVIAQDEASSVVWGMPKAEQRLTAFAALCFRFRTSVVICCNIFLADMQTTEFQFFADLLRNAPDWR